jgi:hypothetical protein
MAYNCLLILKYHVVKHFGTQMWWMAHRTFQSPVANCGEILINLVSYCIGINVVLYVSAFLFTQNLSSLRTVFISHFSSEILTYLDEVEYYCDATLESSKNQLQAVKDSTRNSELKLTTVPRLVNSVSG